MSAIEVQHFLGRARDFFEGMKFLSTDLAEFRYSSALLGIHAAISYSDAIRIGLGSEKLSSDDHSDAAVNLKSMLAARKYRGLPGADRLGKLLSMKSRIAYISEGTTEKQVKDILVQAERFAIWAEDTGKKLNIEGW